MGMFSLLTKIALQPTNIIKKIELEKLFTNKVLELLENSDDLFFLYIGANDGKNGNAIYQFVKNFNLSGIFVEPQKKAFEKLKKNHAGNKSILFENSAITDKDGPTNFYQSKDTYSSSLIQPEELTRRRKIRTLQGKPDVVTINGITLRNLLKKHNISRVDLVVIDTEGYDFKILTQVLKTNITPKIIQFETVLLTKEEKNESIKVLKQRNYEVFIDGWDTLAYKK